MNHWVNEGWVEWNSSVKKVYKDGVIWNNKQIKGLRCGGWYFCLQVFLLLFIPLSSLSSPSSLYHSMNAISVNDVPTAL